MTKLNIHGDCPKCGVSWDAGDIPEESRENYSEPYKFSRLIGVYCRDSDRTVAWRCPDCDEEWEI